MNTEKISKIFQKISGSPSGHLLACCVDLQIELVETQHNVFSHTGNRGLIKFIENTKRALTIGTIRAIITISFIQ